MKRSHDEEGGNEEASKRLKESDVSVLLSLKDKYSQEGREVDSELQIAKEKYLVSYLKKVIEKLPMSKDIIDTANPDEENFFKMYSLAKTCVHSEIQMKKMLAFNSVFDMIMNLVGKGVHDKFVSPYLQGFISETHLQSAFNAYRETLSSEDGATELHCVSYLIQNEIDKKEPLKIPNPMFNRFTQQMKAVSRYITILLGAIAS